jgi:glucose dehydrogenase
MWAEPRQDVSLTTGQLRTGVMEKANSQADTGMSHRNRKAYASLSHPHVGHDRAAQWLSSDVSQIIHTKGVVQQYDVTPDVGLQAWSVSPRAEEKGDKRPLRKPTNLPK